MIYVVFVLGLAGLDLFLKWKVEKNGGEFPRTLARTKEKIMLYRNHNAGFPFGFLEKYQMLVRLVPMIVTSALAGILCYLIPRHGKTAEKLGLAIIIGGSLSNLYDRWVRHYVVDYFSIQWRLLKRVVFNLGDIFVFAGSLILLVRELIDEFR